MSLQTAVAPAGLRWIRTTHRCASRGCSFWESIGKPKFICAPMVDHSYLPFRHLVRKHGVDLCFTQMINAKVFTNSLKYQNGIMDFIDYSNSTDSEFGSLARELDRPLIVQLAGCDATTLIGTGKVLQMHNISAIDVNLGCPQHIAKRGNYGAYLLQDRKLVLNILSSMVNSLDCPITAKIRRLPLDEDTITLVQQMERVGVQMVTIHGRLLTENKQFVGSANWNIIKQIKESVSIPVVANGGVGCLDDAHRCLAETGADAVMAAEGLLENPKMFSVSGDASFKQDFIGTQLSSARELLDLFSRFPTQPTSSLRPHLFKILFRLLSGSKNHDMRQLLAKCDTADIITILDELTRRFALVDNNEEQAVLSDLLGPTRWYARHQTSKDRSTV
jgi:tRNA-dihydrouridine synthase